eukprot:5963570-Amphidinium_carterae.1
MSRGVVNNQWQSVSHNSIFSVSLAWTEVIALIVIRVCQTMSSEISVVYNYYDEFQLHPSTTTSSSSPSNSPSMFALSCLNAEIRQLRETSTASH